MTASTATVSDVEGVTITAVAADYIGSVERRHREIPAHVHNLVRFSIRGNFTREWLLTANNARALAAALTEAAEAVDAADRG